MISVYVFLNGSLTFSLFYAKDIKNARLSVRNIAYALELLLSSKTGPSLIVFYRQMYNF